MLKKCLVVMLSTNEKTSIYLNSIEKISNLIFNPNNFPYHEDLIADNDWISQYLYILSSDEIKEDDWCINKNLDTLYQVKDIPETYNPSKDWYKIIATTDKSLNLPGISQSFIEKYIEKYNKGKKIEEVNVVYIDILKESILEIQSKEIISKGRYQPKVKDNTISIKKIKTSWNREEVVSLLYKSFEEMSDWKNEGLTSHNLSLNIKNWIKENL